jgi:hypothetical protein
LSKSIINPRLLHFISTEVQHEQEDLTAGLSPFLVESTKLLENTSVDDDYKTFLDKETNKLTRAVSAHSFKLHTRIKSAVFLKQAEDEMQEAAGDGSLTIRWVVQVWIPFEPDAYKTGRVEYLEELNQLHHEEGEERGGGKRLRKSESC